MEKTRPPSVAAAIASLRNASCMRERSSGCMVDGRRLCVMPKKSSPAFSTLSDS